MQNTADTVPDFAVIAATAGRAVEELIKASHLQPGQLLVVGASSSEIQGSAVGTKSSPVLGKLLWASIWPVVHSRGIHLAAQCCEHLNRALVVPREVMESRHYTQVNARPTSKAGGAWASVAYRKMPQAVVVEQIQAEAGLDIGHTLIGMHLRPVVCPLRIQVTHVGAAAVVAARTRPKYIGGPRTVYEDEASLGA